MSWYFLDKCDSWLLVHVRNPDELWVTPVCAVKPSECGPVKLGRDVLLQLAPRLGAACVLCDWEETSRTGFVHARLLFCSSSHMDAVRCVEDVVAEIIHRQPTTYDIAEDDEDETFWTEQGIADCLRGYAGSPIVLQHSTSGETGDRTRLVLPTPGSPYKMLPKLPNRIATPFYERHHASCRDGAMRCGRQLF